MVQPTGNQPKKAVADVGQRAGQPLKQMEEKTKKIAEKLTLAPSSPPSLKEHSYSAEASKNIQTAKVAKWFSGKES